MNTNQTFGIITIILGLLFILFPIVSSVAVSIMIGFAVCIAGLILLASAATVAKSSLPLTVLNTILGILAIICGILFIFDIDVLPIVVGLEFFVIGIVFIFFGLSGYLSELKTLSNATSILMIVLGIISIILGIFFAGRPILVSIFVGICLLIQGFRLISDY